MQGTVESASHNFYNNLMRRVTQPFYRKGNQGSEMLNKISSVRQIFNVTTSDSRIRALNH